LGSSAFALGGIAVAWWMYVKQPAVPAKMAEAMPGAYEMSRNRFYLDELYDIFVVKPLSGLAQFCRVLDAYVVDGLVDMVGQLPGFSGALFRRVQKGLVHFYALLMVLGVAGFLLAVLLRWGGWGREPPGLTRRYAHAAPPGQARRLANTYEGP